MSKRGFTALDIFIAVAVPAIMSPSIASASQSHVETFASFSVISTKLNNQIDAESHTNSRYSRSQSAPAKNISVPSTIKVLKSDSLVMKVWSSLARRLAL